MPHEQYIMAHKQIMIINLKALKENIHQGSLGEEIS